MDWIGHGQNKIDPSTTFGLNGKWIPDPKTGHKNRKFEFKVRTKYGIYTDNKELEGYRPEDISRSLLRMISNNIGQVSCYVMVF